MINKAKNHKHDLTRVPAVPANCTQSGNIEYYFCTGCNDCFTDANGKNKIPETTSVEIGALGHVVSDSWKSNAQFHWRICTTCKTVLTETKMHHETVNGVCTSCGYVTAPAETTPKPTTPQNTEPVETTPASTDSPVSAIPTDPAETTMPTEFTTEPPVESSAPTEASPSPQTGNSGNDFWLTILLVALSCFAASITTAVIVLKMKKKGGSE